MEDRISLEVSNTIFITGVLSAGGNCTFRRRCLYTFSTSIIASSTSEPMAMAIPPRLMVLIFRLSRCRAITAESKETGIAIREIMVVRKLMRNKRRMITTSTAPSSKTFCTLLMAVSIKSAWRKIVVSTTTSGGNEPLRALIFSSMLRLSLMVLALGCLEIESITAGVASWEPCPIFTAEPMTTCATSLTLTGFPFWCVIMEAPSSSRLLVRAIPLTTYSLSYCLITLPCEFWLIPLQVSSSSFMLTPKCIIFCGSAKTWYCL